MASKDERAKTSKTARVMNLLSKKHDSAPAEGETPAAAPVPPILSSLAPDAAASNQIKSALETALEEEAASAPAAPAPQPASPQQPSPAAPAAVPAPEPKPVPVQPPQAVPAPAAEEAEDGESLGYVNVMQVLVEEKAPKYVRLFGLCDCPRCLEDVKALALNHLPPKYVVMSQGEMIPKLTFYEGQFSSDITAQLLQACKSVMQRPHHDRII